MSDCVTVTVPARLHLGFLDIDGALGRHFGSIGVALSRPVTRLRLARAERSTVRGPERERATAHLQTMCRHLKIAEVHRLEIETAIPSHAGLGSGTQLALAVAAAVRRLHRLAPDLYGDAELLGRGRRSGVGIGLFQQGGVVVDGGRGSRSAPPPIISRLPFPDEWRIVVLYDRSMTGVHGTDEIDAFARLPSFPAETAAHLCHLTVMRALPALAEHDISTFGMAISEIQCAVGDHFAPAQGGRFSSPKVAAALELLADEGAAGTGQSSWGPTGFAFAATAAEAKALVETVAAHAQFQGLDLDIVRGSNRAAVVDVEKVTTAD